MKIIQHKSKLFVVYVPNARLHLNKREMRQQNLCWESAHISCVSCWIQQQQWKNVHNLKRQSMLSIGCLMTIIYSTEVLILNCFSIFFLFLSVSKRSNRFWLNVQRFPPFGDISCNSKQSLNTTNTAPASKSFIFPFLTSNPTNKDQNVTIVNFMCLFKRNSDECVHLLKCKRVY